MSARVVVCDTETTGLHFNDGDRLIEIGAVEVIDRRKTQNTFQSYVNPEGKEISEGAKAITNISDKELLKAPKFSEVADQFLDFIKGAEVVFHNAQFDVGFINNELTLIGHEITDIRDICTVFDNLMLAKKIFPGQKNSLDALSKRLEITGYDRTYHGALLDSEILADVYLNLTGGQVRLELNSTEKKPDDKEEIEQNIDFKVRAITVGDEELELHNNFLEALSKKSGGNINW